MSGAFITIEGVDGAGKTTHLDFIVNRLADRGAKIVHTREPGGTVLGEQLRKLLLAPGDAPITKTAELLLFFAARAQHINEVIAPALNRGEWVVCDRFIDSTYAYQGGGRGIDGQTIAALETLTMEKLMQTQVQPDLTLWLDIAAAAGKSRVVQKSMLAANDKRANADRFENQDLQFNERVRMAYRRRANEFKHRIKKINADQSVDKVCGEIAIVLDAFWRERNA